MVIVQAEFEKLLYLIKTKMKAKREILSVPAFPSVSNPFAPSNIRNENNYSLRMQHTVFSPATVNLKSTPKL